mgnify:CR=1 FL=1
MRARKEERKRAKRVVVTSPLITKSSSSRRKEVNSPKNSSKQHKRLNKSSLRLNRKRAKSRKSEGIKSLRKNILAMCAKKFSQLAIKSCSMSNLQVMQGLSDDQCFIK